MGLVLALMVFVYPIALPVVTLAVLILAAKAYGTGVLNFSVRAALALGFLMAVLSPMSVSTGAGSFLLPWWLNAWVRDSSVRHYASEYLLTCAALFLTLVLVMAVWRAIRAPSRRR